jgi:hypothetical protein
MFKKGVILMMLMAILATSISCKAEVKEPMDNSFSSSSAYYTEDGELIVPGGFNMQKGYNPNQHMSEWKLRIGRIENGLEVAPEGYQTTDLSKDVYSFCKIPVVNTMVESVANDDCILNNSVWIDGNRIK